MPETFSTPAEWAAHAGTWLAWPHRRSDWPGKFGTVRWAFAEIARLLTRHETLFLLTQNAGHAEEARATLKAAGADLGRVEFVQHPTDRGWMRDCGAIFAHSQAGEKVALDFRFTGWGKYPDHALDDAVPRTVAETRGVRRVEPGAVLEGGSIDFDGAGTLLTTEECLLSPVQERNPGFTRADYEALFRDYLGVSKTIWLGNGVAGDDTHGHVDDLARFTSESTVALMTAPEGDANYAALEENRERLQGARDAKGRAIEVVALPSPRPVAFKGVRLPASYANFLICNAQVLVPTFNDPADRIALGVLAELFPGREVVGVHAVDLVWGLGTIHCMTQQEPAG